MTNAVLLPVVLNYNREGLGEKTALMCRAMALPGEGFDTFYQATTTLLDDLEIPFNLEAPGVAEERAAELARKAHTDAARATNPVPATVIEIESLVRRAIRKAQ